MKMNVFAFTLTFSLSKRKKTAEEIMRERYLLEKREEILDSWAKSNMH